jgi:ribosomal protein S18 acetylase RimI-like enzyme
VRVRGRHVDVRPASSLPLAELAALFNAGYEGYVIPFRLDEPALRWMITVFDIDRDASLVAFDDGEPVGFANLALRGDKAWVGGVGVVTKARRRGIGETLMHALHVEATARGVTEVWLEVIEQNDAAFRLYDKLGYEVVREVEVWSLPAAPPHGSAQEVDAQRARARVRELRRSREPWQRADATLAHYDDLRGLETDGGAAVFRIAGNVQLQQIAGDDAEELLRTLRGRGDVNVVNLPTDDPAAGALRTLGAAMRIRQREMILALQNRG